jgi:putative ABC transport system ATP-binding protein
MISIESLRFAYPSSDFSLSINNLTVDAGTSLAVIGPSGSGKSTLLHLIAGLISPDAGTVNVDGQELALLNEKEVRRFRSLNIGFVYQDFGLLAYLNARDNMLYPYRMAAALKFTPDVEERMENLAEKAGVQGLLKRRPDQLSQGEKQRVAICRALLPCPKLILADEATGNLDPANKKLVLDLLFQSASENASTLVAVTHDYDLLERFDRVTDVKEMGAQR